MATASPSSTATSRRNSSDRRRCAWTRDIVRAGRAILSVMPLDSFVDWPLQRMEVIGRPERDRRGPGRVHGDGRGGGRRRAGRSARSSATRSTRRRATAWRCSRRWIAASYANFILAKGVIGPMARSSARRAPPRAIAGRVAAAPTGKSGDAERRPIGHSLGRRWADAHRVQPAALDDPRHRRALPLFGALGGPAMTGSRCRFSRATRPLPAPGPGRSPTRGWPQPASRCCRTSAHNAVSADPASRQGALDRIRWAVDCLKACGGELLAGPFHQPLGEFTGERPYRGRE